MNFHVRLAIFGMLIAIPLFSLWTALKYLFGWQ